MIAYIWVNFNRNKSLADKYLLILAEKRLTYHAVFAKFITGTAVNRRSFMQYIEIFKKAILLMRRLAALTLAAFMTFLSVLTLGIDALSAGKRHPEVSKVNVLLIGAAERSQGVTTDGKYYYFSSKWGLTKSELDGKTRSPFRSSSRTTTVSHTSAASATRKPTTASTPGSRTARSGNIPSSRSMTRTR